MTALSQPFKVAAWLLQQSYLQMGCHPIHKIVIVIQQIRRRIVTNTAVTKILHYMNLNMNMNKYEPVRNTLSLTNGKSY